MMNKQTDNPCQIQVREVGHKECSMSHDTINHWEKYRDAHGPHGCIPPSKPNGYLLKNVACIL